MSIWTAEELEQLIKDDQDQVKFLQQRIRRRKQQLQEIGATKNP